MTKTTTTLVLVAGLALAGASTVAAQTTNESRKAFIDVNVGAQTSSRTLATTNSFSLYDETATISTSQSIGSGFLFDIGGGYKIWNNLAVGLSLSTYSNTGTGTVTATIPDPVFYDRPTTVNVQSPGLKRSEFGTHIKAVYFIQIDDKMDIAISAGPSFIHVSQDLSTVTVATGTQNVNVAVANQTGTAKGGNVGVDFNYMLKPMYGVGAFIRYAGGSVDLPSVSGVKAGGLQVGVGARLRF